MLLRIAENCARQSENPETVLFAVRVSWGSLVNGLYIAYTPVITQVKMKANGAKLKKLTLN